VGYVERHLLPGERVVNRTRVHWVIFAKPAALAAVGLALVALLWSISEPPWLWMLGGAIAAAGIAGACGSSS
jgi:hypothetical protein